MLADTWTTLQELLKELEHLPDLSDNASSQELSKAVDIENITPKLAELKKMLNISDMNSENILQEVKEALFSLHPVEATELSEAINSLDFKQASKVLQRILLMMK